MSEDYIVRVLDFSFGQLIVNQAFVGDVGCVVWDAAIVLAKFIDGPYFKKMHSFKDSFFLELGSGTGLLGLTAAALGGNVILTDLENLIPLIQKNIQCNKSVIKGECSAMVLKWGSNLKYQSPPDIILVSDCIYYEDSLLLVNTMLQFCSSKTIIYLSYEERNTKHKTQLVEQFFLSIPAYLSVE